MSDESQEPAMSNDQLSRAESALFQELGVQMATEYVPVVFIVGAPRSGSTVLYQLLVNQWTFTYFSNFTNHCFFRTPALGVAVEAGARLDRRVSYTSTYGKTRGAWEPSEASAVFRNWYGGEHPSETRSATALPEKSAHMMSSLAAVWRLRRRPILAKNAWNCFRIQDLATRFAGACFVWIRRDVVSAASSDLEAREQRGSKYHWNSATPANVEAIRARPYWEQVVEQQYEFHRAIDESLRAWATDRYLDVWYEDMCSNLDAVIQRLACFLEGRFEGCMSRGMRIHPIAPRRQLSDHADTKRIVRYVEGPEARRLAVLRRVDTGCTSPQSARDA